MNALLKTSKCDDAKGYRLDPLVIWLVREAWAAESVADLLARFAKGLIDAGFPLASVSFTSCRETGAETVAYYWVQGGNCVEQVSDPPWAEQLLRVFSEKGGVTAKMIRLCRIGRDGASVAEWCREQPFSDVGEIVAIRIPFLNGCNALALAADRTRDFGDDELTWLSEIMPTLGRVFETLALRNTMVSLLDTYLGKRAGKYILDGLMRRGDGEDIDAIIWYCDLRDSTRLTASMSRQAYLSTLDEFFDCMAEPVLNHDGEVLRFIGDAVLGIFPTGRAATVVGERLCAWEVACDAAMMAVQDASRNMRTLNRKRGARGEPPLGFGLALHRGGVTYGNIGIPRRLEFTVIGEAANEVVRIEELCKSLGQPVLISAEFARCYQGRLISHGHHTFKGVEGSKEIFSLPLSAQD